MHLEGGGALVNNVLGIEGSTPNPATGFYVKSRKGKPSLRWSPHGKRVVAVRVRHVGC